MNWLRKILGSSTVERPPVKRDDAGSTPAPGAGDSGAEGTSLPRSTSVNRVPPSGADSEEYIAAEVVDSHCERWVAAQHPMANAHGRMSELEQRRAAQDMQNALADQRLRTAFPMRGRFHCCDPKLVYAIDLGFDLEKCDVLQVCICELCGWEFTQQRYVPVPGALPAESTPPPLAADVNEPKRGEHAIRKLARDAAGHGLRRLKREHS